MRYEDFNFFRIRKLKLEKIKQLLILPLNNLNENSEDFYTTSSK